MARYSVLYSEPNQGDNTELSEVCCNATPLHDAIFISVKLPLVS